MVDMLDVEIHKVPACCGYIVGCAQLLGQSSLHKAHDAIAHK